MNNDILSGQLLDEHSQITIIDLCYACQVKTEWVIDLVEEGIIEPNDQTTEEWQFTGESLQRAMIVRRLQRDLGINFAGAALVLELMEENERLRAQLSR
ncbi:MAG: MerR family transcriptional regulator [Gammaproteobacteria bacterium CG22_combo_CG10-13_8_21_14_all_40_8]|nr:MAG: MerR family transcriptional regulator [Gammaproteobacteria bacterium CG22_combo_CG10-13_8_21_14_all_40_8]